MYKTNLKAYSVSLVKIVQKSKKVFHTKGELDPDCSYHYSCHSAYSAPILAKFGHIYQGGAPLLDKAVFIKLFRKYSYFVVLKKPVPCFSSATIWQQPNK